MDTKLNSKPGLVAIAEIEEEIKALKDPLERYRMRWLFGALAVVVGGILYSYASAQKKAPI